MYLGLIHLALAGYEMKWEIVMRYVEPEVDGNDVGDDSVGVWLFDSSARHYHDWQTLVGVS